MAIEAQQQPQWFTPMRLLVLFCVINLLNYVDRGVIASNGVNGAPGNYTCRANEACSHGSGIQGEFKLSNFQDGVLSSAFMGGLLVASPIFAELTKSCNPFRLIGVGLSVWTFATAGCGFSVGFWSIASFRLLVGVGEASFVSLAAPFIDDYAPPEQKSRWLSYFYMCIPVGVALGYVFGGVVGSLLHWRAAFFLEALIMLPFAVFGFVSAPINLMSNSNDDLYTLIDEEQSTVENSERSAKRPGLSKLKGVLYDFRDLFQNKVYMINVLGYIAFNFVLGAYSYWGPKAGEAIYQMKSADLIFGGVTMLCGVIGTFVGGAVLDFIGSSIRNGFKLLALSTIVGGVGCMLAFSSRNVVLFIFLFAVAELFLFATQGPVNQLNLQSVPQELRALAMATSTVLIHVLGDVPSSPLVGLVEDKLHNWRSTALILTSIYFLAAAFWLWGFLLFFFGSVEEKQSPQAGQEETTLIQH
ncbi:probable sphingolipid transporter spinster homolog 2 isoform X1 [Selaginella moellendorffii]|uniref:probable sphingolipid transporter spinster homolog 2 isoform X1 n=1 Tax=Selaginella moellendorffii TaxID=88036 RepID=UPI000D1C4BA3|nr:probable sphingolipid transporter spinster homolog 2 isoform X1 [Selaginella moellendorffii]|eukprot:XP_024537460.1 probable sphingolipid transporter spinster homolog 2 isoform X1 [Selaginella moellendorffii]